MCESRSKPDPKPLFGCLARRARRSSQLPMIAGQKADDQIPFLERPGVCRTKASLTRADILAA